METNDYTPRDYTLERWIVLLLSLLFLLPFVARAQEPKPALTTLTEYEGAGLLLKTVRPGVYLVAPAVSSDVSITVTGPIVRTHVRQTFHNASVLCVEGVYVFPLPERSAVDTMRMTIGTRVIEGEVREREEARREYEQAVSEGRKAALVEQHRPNVFTTSVASVMPDEHVVIDIEYQETARFENGEYRLRFPMVVAPRYTPARVDPVAAAASMPAPADSTRNTATANVTLSVALNPGFSVRDVTSLHHKIRTQTLGDRKYVVELDEKSVPADRDFELAWQPNPGGMPDAALLAEKCADGVYALVMVTPPAQAAVRLPRETIFIIDSSGSMQGPSMEQAKAALQLALDDLRPGDKFNIIDFDSDARPLFDSSRFADPANVGAAKHFVDSIVADGGTEMLGALRLALPESITSSGMVRQVIFMTDGQVGNEQELFRYIHDHLGDSRLFTVGIGAAPNSHFMHNAARFGRGTFTYVGDREQVKDRMSELFAKLDSPMMTDIEVKSSDGSAEIWPARVPDLYRGEPLVVALRLRDPAATISLHGRIGNAVWQATPALPSTSSDGGIAKLWAREKIESLMDRLSEGADPGVVRSEVVAVALQHHLVSAYTSIVAVDKTAQGLAAAACQSQRLPVDSNGTPEQDGTLPQTDTPAKFYLVVGFALICAAVALLKFI